LSIRELGETMAATPTLSIAGLLVAVFHPGSAFLPAVLRGSFVAAFGAYGFLATAYVA
jgi:hypothetical protein